MARRSSSRLRRARPAWRRAVSTEITMSPRKTHRQPDRTRSSAPACENSGRRWPIEAAELAIERADLVIAGEQQCGRRTRASSPRKATRRRFATLRRAAAPTRRPHLFGDDIDGHEPMIDVRLLNTKITKRVCRSPRPRIRETDSASHLPALTSLSMMPRARCTGTAALYGRSAAVSASKMSAMSTCALPREYRQREGQPGSPRR